MSNKPTSLKLHISKTISLAWPVILGHLGHVLIMQADTLMIGKLGSVPLAAATLGNSMFILPFVIGIGIAIAISPLVSQFLGANRHEETKLLLSQGSLLAFWTGLIFVGVTLIVAELLPFMGQDPDVVPLAQEYMRYIGLSALPMLIYMALKHFADGFEDVVPGMLTMGAIVVVNIFGNWLLIEGHWGFPRMELAGAGVATLAARCFGLVIIWVYIRKSKRYRNYRSAGFSFRHHLPSIKRILKLGLPSGIQHFFEVGAFSGAVIIIGWISPEAQSAHQIALGIPAITYMVYLGLSGAASIRVGNALGRKDFHGLRQAGKAAIWCGVVFIFISIILIAVFHQVIPHWYIDNPEVIGIATKLILIAAFFQVSDGVQIIALGALRGMEDVKTPTMFTFIAYWVIGIPIGLFLMKQFDMGAEGIWYGLLAGLTFSALFLTVRFERMSRQAP